MTSSSSSASPPPRSLHLPPPSQSHSASASPKHGILHLSLPPTESKSPPPKKSPPLPWTHQETLALIQAYQEKWYSLKKGQLKAFQWEEVAVTVAARCGFDEPSKTATQCRHKIEKLRKRYRSELQKAYPNSWQYFELMDQMERGPIPLNARPITVAKSFPNYAHSNANANATSNSNNNVSSFSHGYGSFYSSSTDYYNNDGGGGGAGDGGGSDDSDEKWNMDHGVTTAARNKSKSINHIVRGDVRSVNVGVGRVKMEQYYDGGGDSDDGDDDEAEEEEEEEREAVEEEEGGGMVLAAEIRGFTERFMGMESRKIEMMQETERYRREMEKKRTEMIVEAQRKMVDAIGKAFGAHKRAKMAQES
ncbi:hypothetical protein C2S53_010745 [Perilla frutescens var. hirtella]|uniref:Myb-like domain-containing protein n=1 Tax=Perilla frutescens var. hirtella TaxID=608512 RepID=A0AAD4JAY4_PERFH|nr:hypothetical protein C2S53_010745 [Perilla frutescens var. hirtella]